MSYSVPVPNKLPRFSLDHPDLIIRDNSRDFNWRGLMQKDFDNWHLNCHPSIPFTGDHKTAHELRCRFIFDFYLEFTDRQYLKNIGYRRSGKENWADIYAEYIDLPFVQADPNLETVIQNTQKFWFCNHREPRPSKRRGSRALRC